mgnify:CR=1 FL=1
MADIIHILERIGRIYEVFKESIVIMGSFSN